MCKHAKYLYEALVELKTANGSNNFTGWHPSFEAAINLANFAMDNYEKDEGSL